MPYFRKTLTVILKDDSADKQVVFVHLNFNCFENQTSSLDIEFNIQFDATTVV